MRVPSVACLGLTLGLLAAPGSLAYAGEEAQLIDTINVYRSQAQRCGGEASLELPPQRWAWLR